MLLSLPSSHWTEGKRAQRPPYTVRGHLTRGCPVQRQSLSIVITKRIMSFLSQQTLKLKARTLYKNRGLQNVFWFKDTVDIQKIVEQP